MGTSTKKITANRSNGQKSVGPKNTISTRFNASKHGLLAAGVTELDDIEGHRSLLDQLQQEQAPIGVVETMLVESVALNMTRLRRAQRLEADYITGELNPPITKPGVLDFGALDEPSIIDPGLPAAIGFEACQRLVNVFQRYETAIVNRIFRLLHELERLQRMRCGERLPAPAVVDVSIHSSGSGILEALEKSVDIGKPNSIPAALDPESTSGGVDVAAPTRE